MILLELTAAQHTLKCCLVRCCIVFVIACAVCEFILVTLLTLLRGIVLASFSALAAHAKLLVRIATAAAGE